MQTPLGFPWKRAWQVYPPRQSLSLTQVLKQPGRPSATPLSTQLPPDGQLELSCPTVHCLLQ